MVPCGPRGKPNQAFLYQTRPINCVPFQRPLGISGEKVLSPSNKEFFLTQPPKGGSLKKGREGKPSFPGIN